ncbi:MAG TPA: sulfite exporter TauE/SafE family protein [Ramlibacter sp.]|nr:sulfite exporter TauE/SafE family protein [Ramlibacter sp.]
MSQTHISEFILVSCIFFAAGMVKGILGMGLPTLGMGLLGLLMTVPQAAGLLTMPSLVTNVWQALAGRALRRRRVRGLWRLQVGICAGVAVASFLPSLQDGLARGLLGACLAAYGTSGLSGWRPRPLDRAMGDLAAPAVGALTGVITALTGVFVLPAVPYLQSLQLDRHELAQALGLSFTTSTVALAALLAARGQLGVAASLQSTLAIAPALAGMLVGQKVRDAMSEAAFRRCFFGGLLLLGLWLVVG